MRKPVSISAVASRNDVYTLRVADASKDLAAIACMNDRLGPREAGRGFECAGPASIMMFSAENVPIYDMAALTASAPWRAPKTVRLDHAKREDDRSTECFCR